MRNYQNKKNLVQLQDTRLIYKKNYILAMKNIKNNDSIHNGIKNNKILSKNLKINKFNQKNYKSCTVETIEHC